MDFWGFLAVIILWKKNDQGTFHISYHRTPHAGSTALICWKVYAQNTPNIDEQMFWHDDNRNLLPVFLKSGSPETLGLWERAAPNIRELAQLVETVALIFLREASFHCSNLETVW